MKKTTGWKRLLMAASAVAAISGVPSVQAFDMGNMMNPSKWFGGNRDHDDYYYDRWGGPGYGGYGYGPGWGGYGPGWGGYGPGWGGYPGYGYGYGAPGYGYGGQQQQQSPPPLPQ
jgi:hypothetical protein